MSRLPTFCHKPAWTQPLTLPSDSRCSVLRQPGTGLCYTGVASRERRRCRRRSAPRPRENRSGLRQRVDLRERDLGEGDLQGVEPDGAADPRQRLELCSCIEPGLPILLADVGDARTSSSVVEDASGSSRCILRSARFRSISIWVCA
jgi:hypothetical protein